jgi:hypothetical protein
MSLLYHTDEKAHLKHSDYGLILALVCLALGLVARKFTMDFSRYASGPAKRGDFRSVTSTYVTASTPRVVGLSSA